MNNQHRCDKDQRRALYDARGLFCCYVCDQCEETKRSRFHVSKPLNHVYSAARPSSRPTCGVNPRSARANDVSA